VYGIGGAYPWMAPMAPQLGWVVIFATALALALAPCLYSVGNNLGEVFARKERRQEMLQNKVGTVPTIPT
jgi:hypothetical protein